jgi:hypothetical protein
VQPESFTYVLILRFRTDNDHAISSERDLLQNHHRLANHLKAMYSTAYLGHGPYQGRYFGGCLPWDLGRHRAEDPADARHRDAYPADVEDAVALASKHLDSGMHELLGGKPPVRMHVFHKVEPDGPVLSGPGQAEAVAGRLPAGGRAAGRVATERQAAAVSGGRRRACGVPAPLVRACLCMCSHVPSLHCTSAWQGFLKPHKPGGGHAYLLVARRGLRARRISCSVT